MGMMMGGGGLGGWGGGGNAHAQSAQAGLPFAGIPEELVPAMERLSATEPEWETADIPFSYRREERARYSLRRLLSGHMPALTFAIVLVVAETILLQAGPFLVKVGIDNGIQARNVRALVFASCAYLLSVVLGAVATGSRTAWTARLAQKLNFEQRVRVFSHLQRLSLDFFTEEKAGRIISRMTSDIEATNQMLQNGLVQMVVQLLTIVIVAGVLFSMNVVLAAFVVLLVLPAMGLLTNWFRVESDAAYERVRSGIAAVLSDLAENLSGVRAIIANNRQRVNVLHHREVVGDYRDANIYTAQLNALYGPSSQAIGVAAQALVLAVGGWMALHHSLTIGELTAFVLYLTSFFAPIQQLAQLYNTYQQGQAGIYKLADLLDTQPSVSERPDAVELPPIQGDILFENVSFGYDPHHPVLKDVTLHIGAGETLSFVGATGAGKSTMAKLATRFYDPTAGRVLIDGFDLRQVTIQSLRRQLGVVPQEPFLFSGTIRDNIAFARPDATNGELLEAARAVGMGELIERLPEGLDTQCHERGASLSSGERQLLALARAFLARPRVLVLDEATSNLDLASEAMVEAGLNALLEGRTAIIIAHRLSTAMRADRIAVVDHGKIVELGSHEELIALDGQYAEMYRTWVSHAEEPATELAAPSIKPQSAAGSHVPAPLAIAPEDS